MALFRTCLKLLFLLDMIFLPNTAFAGSACRWEHWDRFWETHVQSDGRVIDYGEGREASYSEGQAYSLFFALVANDRNRFATLLKWTEDELAGGNLKANLPAWKWGRLENSQWGVIDHNAASDADMWLAYVLMEAGRLWHEQRYQEMGLSLLDNIKSKEIASLPDGRKQVLPGPEGFSHDNQSWRFNPSYYPLQVLRRFTTADPEGPWKAIISTTVEMLLATSPHGFAPDWVAFNRDHGWVPDLKSEAVGSYDAIRVYLWVGMLNEDEQYKSTLLAHFKGMAKFLRNEPGSPPKRINTLTGEVEIPAPAGFSGALLPYLAALQEKGLLERQRSILIPDPANGLVGSPPRYYDQVLTMFGQGWLEQRFAFAAKGELLPNWKGCPMQH